MAFSPKGIQRAAQGCDALRGATLGTKSTPHSESTPTGLQQFYQRLLVNHAEKLQQGVKHRFVEVSTSGAEKLERIVGVSDKRAEYPCELGADECVEHEPNDAQAEGCILALERRGFVKRAAEIGEASGAGVGKHEDVEQLNEVV